MTDVDAMVRDAVLAAVDDRGLAPVVLAEHIAGRLDVADAVTVAAVLLAAALLVDLAEHRGIERGRIAGLLGGAAW